MSAFDYEKLTKHLRPVLLTHWSKLGKTKYYQYLQRQHSNNIVRGGNLKVKVISYLQNTKHLNCSLARSDHLKCDLVETPRTQEAQRLSVLFTKLI